MASLGLTYFTDDELFAIIPEVTVLDLTDDFRTGVINGDILLSCEAQAKALMEVYTRRFYPDLQKSPAVTALLGPLLKYKLYARRGSIPEDVTKEYEMTMKAVAAITPSSLGIPGIEPAAGTSSGVLVSAPVERFGEDFMNLTSSY